MSACVCILLLITALVDSNNSVIEEFFKKHSISHGVVLNCYSKRERFQILKRLATNENLLLSASLNMRKVNLIDLLYITHGRLGVVLDGGCMDSKKIISMCGRHRFFDIKYYWLIEIAAGTTIEPLFSEANTNIDSNIYAINNQTLDVYEFYNPASLKGGTNKIGGFNSYNDNNNKFWRRRDLSGVTFDTTLVLHEPYSGSHEQYLQTIDEREKNTYSRYHSLLMRYCQKHYNFSLNIRNVTSLFGYQKGDGTMDGLVGDLERHISDFGISPLSMRKDRAEIISFGRLTYVMRADFVFRNPKSINMFELFLRPLSPNVWYCLLVLSVMAALFIKLISVNECDSGWAHCVLCVIGMLAQQGATFNPRRLSGKIGMLFILNLLFFVYIFYSGSLVSSLLNIPLDLIESVDDLLNANFKVGLENNRFNREHFRYTIDNSSIKLYQTLVKDKEHEVYLDPLVGLHRMTEERYAFHVETTKAYHFLRNHFQEHVCEVREVLMYAPSLLYANYEKHSPFRDIMDVCLHRIAESGVMQKEYRFWHTNKPPCIYSHTISTGIVEIYPILICMTIGIAISTTILLCEVMRVVKRKTIIRD